MTKRLLIVAILMIGSKDLPATWSTTQNVLRKLIQTIRAPILVSSPAIH